MNRPEHSDFAVFVRMLPVMILATGIHQVKPATGSPPQQESEKANVQHQDNCDDSQGDDHGNGKGNENKGDENKDNGKKSDNECRARGSSSGIAKGDFNGDGIADLAIGIPGKDPSFPSFIPGLNQIVTDAGAVQIIYGTAANGLAASGTAVPASQFITEVNPRTFPFPF